MKKLIKKSNEIANNLESYYDYAPGYFCGGVYCYCSEVGGAAPTDTVQVYEYNESYATSTNW